jgi:CheY-like chemotaxis protein
MPNADTGKIRVLVVEDDDLNRQSLAEVLEMEGFRVTVAANGAQAVAKLEAELPHLILLDMKMPVMNGWEFLAEIQRRPDWTAIPIIVESAVGEPEDPLPAGVAMSVTKPYEVDKLLESIRRLTGQVRQRAGGAT